VCVCVIINVNFYTAHYFLITALRNLSCTIFASSAANQPAGQPLWWYQPPLSQHHII